MRLSVRVLLVIAVLAAPYPLYRKWVKNPKNRYIVIENPHYDSGMFSVFSTVLGFLDSYEKNHNPGLVIDFADKGLYYEPTKGMNWWEYYLEPVQLGKPVQKKRILKYSDSQYQEVAMHVQNHLTRVEAYELIQKYFKIRQPILDRVDQFVKANFCGHFVIGIHYRGTDKYTEAIPVSYEIVKDAILSELKDRQIDQCQIFVATDEEPFLEYLQSTFPGRICCLDMKRSQGDLPLHLSPQHPAQQGEEAMIDALLLSKVDLLIRTQSNLSLWATYFNPSLPVVLLNQRL